MIIFYAKPFQLRKQWLPFELLYESDISPWRNSKYLFASLGVELKSLNRRCEAHARLPVSPRWTVYKYLQNILSHPDSVLVSLLTYCLSCSSRHLSSLKSIRREERCNPSFSTTMPTSDDLGSDESRDMVVSNEETEEVDNSERSHLTMIITKMCGVKLRQKIDFVRPEINQWQQVFLINDILVHFEREYLKSDESIRI